MKRTLNEQPFWLQHYPVWLATFYRHTNHDQLIIQHIARVFEQLCLLAPDPWPENPLRILDLGLGTGKPAKAVCDIVTKYYGKSTHVYGIDIQADKSAFARQLLGPAATILQGDMFRADLPTLFPKALPAHVVLWTHAAYFVPIPWRKPLRRRSAPSTLLALSRFWRRSMRRCFGEQTVGCLLHMHPFSSLLAGVLKCHGMAAHTVSRSTFTVDYPVLNDRGWEQIANGAFSSLETVEEALLPAQHMQHLIEMHRHVPLHILSSEERLHYVRQWREKLEAADYRMPRTDVLTLVTARNGKGPLREAARQLARRDKSE